MGTASGSIASEALFWPVGTTLFLYNNRNGILTHKLELGLGRELEGQKKGCQTAARKLLKEVLLANHIYSTKIKYPTGNVNK